MTNIQDRDLHLVIFSAECLNDGYGSATALRTFVEVAIAHSSWRLTLVVPSSLRGDRRYPTRRVRILSIPNLGIGSRAAQILSYSALGWLRSAARSIPTPDAVISWQPMPAAALGYLASKTYRVPHIVRTCGPELARQWSRFPLITSASKPLTQLLLGGADAVVIKSDLERTLLGRAVVGDRVHLIPNAVGQQFFVAPSEKVGKTTRFLAVCQLEAHKGIAQLLPAFAAATRKSTVRCSLTVAGDGSHRRHLEQVAAEANAGIKFLGRIPHASMPALYASHNAFILPSVMEGCSNAALEAAAAGLPIIGTNTALSDLVDDEVNGVLADGADIGSLTAVLTRFLALHRQQESMGVAARRTAQAHHPERLLRSYGELLASLC